MLDEYLRANGCIELFTEESNLRCLRNEHTKKLSRNITSFIEYTYTLEAKKTDIFDVCAAAIDLFPSMKTEPSEVNGIVRNKSFLFIFFDKAD